MKKAQLTLMIIIGIVLVISIGLVIWIGGQTAQRKTEPGAEQQRLRQVAVQPVKDYIQSCLDVTTSESLETLGKQGGILYESQGGLTPDVLVEQHGESHVVYDELNVPYIIKPPERDIGVLYFAQPDAYPWVTFPHVFNKTPEDGQIIRTSYSGYFGSHKFPPLFKPAELSIQEQLETAINNNLPECTDWEQFELQGLAIEAGVANSSVIIAENATEVEYERFFSVILRWPVKITDKTTGGETEINEFALSYPVHLAKLYHLVREVVYDEVNNVSADPREFSTELTPVTILENVFADEEGEDDIIVIQDAESFIRGKPLEFRILRMNRIPAMVWINETRLHEFVFFPMGLCEDVETMSVSGSDFDIEWAEDTRSNALEWHSKLEAADPDEDNPVFILYPEDGKIDPIVPGADFPIKICVTDAGEAEDCQPIMLKTRACPIPE